MANIINGRDLAEKIKDKITKEIIGGRKGAEIVNCPRPNLAIVLIGQREDSELYVKLKEREAKKVGIDTHVYRCADNVSEQEILEMINFLNHDDQIDGILVQLPLPAGIDTDTVVMALDSAKDIDGFHPDNLEKLFHGCDHAEIMPPVFATVLAMLESIDCQIKNKRVCIIANSDIFGKGLGHVLTCRGAKVTITNADDKSLSEKTTIADILITAVGKPEFIKKNMIKQDAIVIDIGITKVDGKVHGDVDFNDVESKAGYITPVPGGVGPMTIALALENTWKLFKRKHDKREGS